MVNDLLNEIQSMGIRLKPEGKQLLYWPKTAVARELQARRLAQKDELVAHLVGAKSPQPPSLSDSSWRLHRSANQCKSKDDLPSELVHAFQNSTVDWNATEAREERLAIALEGCQL